MITVPNFNIKEYAKLIRLQSFGFSTIPVIGALTVIGEKIDYFHFLTLFFIGILLTAYSFVLNDYKDFQVDKISAESNERPLVKGTISLKSSKYIIIICLVLTIILHILYFRNLITSLILIIVILLGTLYNFFNKIFAGSDLFISGELALLSLYGAFAVSKNLQDVNNLSWIISLIIFFHVYFANAIAGGLKDIKNDINTKSKKLTIYLGVKANEKINMSKKFKVVSLLIKSTMFILVFVPFIFFNLNFFYWQIVLIIFLIILNIRTTIKILNIKKYNKKQIITLTGKDVFLSFCIILIMIMNYSGFFWTIILISLPLLWFIVFDYLLYGELFTKSRMI